MKATLPLRFFKERRAASHDPGFAQRSPLVRYAVAALLSLGATVLTAWLRARIGEQLFFPPFTGAVVIAAWFGGIGPALLTSGAGLVINLYGFTEHGRSLTRPELTDLARLGTFLIVAVFVSLLVQSRNKAVVRYAEQLEWWRVALKSIGDAVIVAATDGRVVFMNTVSETLTGWPNEEASGRRLDEVFRVVNEATREPVENPVAKVLRTGFVVGLANHTLLIRRDGTHVPIDDSAAPVRDETGQIRGVVLVYRDATPVRMTEKALQGQADRLRLHAELLDQAYDAAFVRDEQERLTYWNRAAARLYGWTAEEAQGRSPHELLKTRFPVSLAEVSAALKRDGHWSGELVHTTRDGREVLVDSRQVRLENSLSGEARILETNRDVTELRRNMEALRISEERLRVTLHNSPVVVWNQDRELRYTWIHNIDPAWVGTEMLGRTDEEVLRPGDAAQMTALKQRVIETGVAERRDVHMISPQGASTYFDLWIEPLRDSAGAVAGITGVAINVTGRHLSQQREMMLLEASSLLSTSLDSTAVLTQLTRLVVPALADWCVIDLVDGEGHVRRVTGSHRDPARQAVLDRLLRIEPTPRAPGAEAIRTSRPLLVPVAPDDLIERLARTPEHARMMQSLGERSLMAVPLFARGRAVGAITFIYGESGRVYQKGDLPLAEAIARRAGLAIDNARLYNEAQEANRLKDEFLATLSHELRTPLNAIRGWTQMLRGGRLDPAVVQRAYETIDRNAQAQTQLITDILDVSRIITGKLRLELEPMDLADVVEAALEGVRPAAQAKRLHLDAAYDVRPAQMVGDRDRLQQVFWNLLSNAVKFTPAGGRVSLKLSVADSRYQVVVSDSGIGISPEFLPRVFERFSQSDASASRAYGGLGLGLAISRHLAELHGGTIDVDSEGEGKGATFTVSLPVRAVAGDAEAGRARASQATGQPADDTASLRGTTVLVVDDEKDARDLLFAVLRQHGADVLLAASSAEALLLLPQRRPAVILSDIGMPDEDGYAFIAKVRGLPPEAGGETPAIALTAYAREEDRLRALAAGYQQHVAKPIVPSELVVVVAALARSLPPAAD